MAQLGTTSRPALVAALLTTFFCYLVADPDLDLYSHYKDYGQVQGQHGAKTTDLTAVRDMVVTANWSNH